MIINPYEEEANTYDEEENIETDPDVSEPKLYTEDDLNARLDELLAKKIARREAKIRREFESKYGEVENVLKAGMGAESLDDALDELKEYYSSQGIDLDSELEPQYTERDAKLLGTAEAQEIISAGIEDVQDEIDRLAAIGYENLGLRDKVLFGKLAEYQREYNTISEYESLGVPEEVVKSDDFKSFASKFSYEASIEDIVDLYSKKTGMNLFQKNQIGSMRNIPGATVKDYYTPEEVDKLTLEDLDNPQIMAAVTKSMSKW